MKQVVQFEYEGLPVRCLPSEEGGPWFLAADVGAILEIGNVSHAVNSQPIGKSCYVRDFDGVDIRNDMLLVDTDRLKAITCRCHSSETGPFYTWLTEKILPGIEASQKKQSIINWGKVSRTPKYQAEQVEPEPEPAPIITPPPPPTNENKGAIADAWKAISENPGFSAQARAQAQIKVLEILTGKEMPALRTGIDWGYSPK